MWKCDYCVAMVTIPKENSIVACHWWFPAATPGHGFLTVGAAHLPQIEDQRVKSPMETTVPIRNKKRSKNITTTPKKERNFKGTKRQHKT